MSSLSELIDSSDDYADTDKSFTKIRENEADYKSCLLEKSDFSTATYIMLSKKQLTCKIIS